MEILFKNTTTYTKKELNRFLKFHSKRNMVKLILLAIIVVIMAIYILIINLIHGNWKSLIFIILLFILMVAYYKYIKYEPKINNNKKQQDQVFLFSFYQDYIKIESKLESSNIKYYKVYKIFETDDNFYIYVNREYAIILNKNGFILGTIKEFRQFIKKKCIFKYKKIVK